MTAANGDLQGLIREMKAVFSIVGHIQSRSRFILQIDEAMHIIFRAIFRADLPSQGSIGAFRQRCNSFCLRRAAGCQRVCGL